MTVPGLAAPQVNVGNSNPSFPFAQGYNVKIGARWYRTVASKEVQIQFQTKDSLAERQDIAGSIYANILDIGYAWARTDLSGGEGLDWDPRILAVDKNKQALDKMRFWDSANIDISRPDTAGFTYALRLSRMVEEWSETFTDPIDMTNSEKHLYIAAGDEVFIYSSWASSTPQIVPAASRIIAIAAAPNDTLMVTCENGNVYAKRSDENVFTKVYGDGGQAKLAAHGVWYVQGRFIVSAWDHKDSTSLFTIEWAYDRGAGEWQPEKPIDSASAPFWSVVESGPAIVAAVGDGTVRTYAPDKQSGLLDVVPWARTTMPEGETPILLGSNAGVLLVMTTMTREELDRDEVRIYQAEVLGDQYHFTVGQLQLRREWLATHHEPLVTRAMASTRDEIFWFVREADLDLNKAGLHGVPVEALWRFDVVTAGLSRETVSSVVPNSVNPDDPPVSDEQTNLNNLLIFSDKAGAIDYTTGKVMLGDKKRFQSFGYMIFPNITFGLNTDITWMATVLEASDLSDTGAQVELWRSTDPDAVRDWQHDSWVLERRMSSNGSSGEEVPMLNILSRSLSLQLRIAASDNVTRSPKVTRVAIRGIPAHRDFIMQIPINISDYVSVPGRRPTRVPGLGSALHAQILDLIGTSVEVMVVKPNVMFRGIVNNVGEPVTYVPDRGAATTYVYVEFRGSRMQALALATGDAGLGLGLLGITTIGIGQTEQE